MAGKEQIDEGVDARCYSAARQDGRSEFEASRCDYRDPLGCPNCPYGLGAVRQSGEAA